MGDAETPKAAPRDCAGPTDLQQQIADLEKQSRDQEARDKKAQLEVARKIEEEIEKAELKYRQEYESTESRYRDLNDYKKTRLEKLTEKVKDDKDKLDDLARCEYEKLEYLETLWTSARAEIPQLEFDYASASNNRADAEVPYRLFLDYATKLKDLDDLKNRSTKELEAENYRAAYFLVSSEMERRLPGGDPPQPGDFNTQLEALAFEYFDKKEKERYAKAALDIAKSDSAKKKKDYDDTEKNLQARILKEIADEPWGAAADGDGQVEAPLNSEVRGSSPEPR